MTFRKEENGTWKEELHKKLFTECCIVFEPKCSKDGHCQVADCQEVAKHFHCKMCNITWNNPSKNHFEKVHFNHCEEIDGWCSFVCKCSQSDRAHYHCPYCE